MKLPKALGRVGFVIGFLGPLLFYASPPSLFTYESHVVCPYCPYVDIAFATRMTWLQVGLQAGLFFGLVLALTGFLFGYIIAKLRRSRSESVLDAGRSHTGIRNCR
jgi:hypothetical protein